MTSLTKSILPRILPISLFITGLIILQPLLAAWQQEALKYTAEEYKAYQDITGETDVAKKAGLVVKFLQENPKSELRQHVISAYQNAISESQTKKRWSEVIAAGEQFIKVVPDDVATTAMLATAFQETKNYRQFVIYGEKTYEKGPSGNLAYYLTKAYKELGNNDKFLAWGEKTVAHLPDNHEILIELAKGFAKVNKNTQAVKYARQGVKVLQAAAKPASVSDKDWKDYTSSGFANCYAIIGNVAYEGKDYAGAVSNLENSLRYFSRNDLVYYYLGLSYWQLGKVDVAMKSFAKSYLLRGSSSGASRQHLDNLYKSTHQQSLVGLDRVIEKAREELK